MVSSLRVAAHQGPIGTADTVGTKLQAQLAFRLGGESEHDQAARLLVEAMDGAADAHWASSRDVVC